MSGKASSFTARSVRAVAVAIVLTLLWAAAPALGSSSFYWYGENHTTCWQTGQPGAPSPKCDTVGAGFLSELGGGSGGLAHMVEGGISAQVALTASGDYCGFYRLGDQLRYQEATNQGVNTDFTTPTPYSSYQESDGHQNTCQADGSQWGQEVLDSAAGNGCSETCGMNHYASFGGQGTSDRPWSKWFGEPTLVVSTEARLAGFKRTGSGTDVGAWGYVCPVLEDTMSGDILEYCLQEWRSKYNTAEWGTERIGTCASADNKNIDTVQSMFSPGTSYATEYPGTTSTYVAEGQGNAHFEAGITRTNLVNAVNADNSKCKRSSSTNPENYALLGVENGLEGWRELAFLGGYTNNLQLRTEYTPLPPSPVTEIATGVGATEAELHGRVNADAVDTHYWFEYGPTTSYGSTTAVVDIGAGTEAKPVSTEIAGLSRETTYHYRLVASSAGGTSYGGDQTLQTVANEESSRWAIREPIGERQWVYYQEGSHEVAGWYLESGGWHSLALPAHSAATGTTPSVASEPNGQRQWVYFQESSGAIGVWYLEAGAWHEQSLPGFVADAGTSPSVVREPNGEQQWVYYQEATHELAAWHLGGGAWHHFSLPAHYAAAASSPAVVREPIGERQWVYFEESSGAIGVWYLEAGVWHELSLTGYSAASGATPSVIRESNGERQWVYYQEASGGVGVWYLEGGAWHHVSLSGYSVAGGTGPSVVGEPNGERQWVYYQESSGAIGVWYLEASGWHHLTLGGTAATAASPAAVRVPHDEKQWVYYQEGGGMAVWYLEAGAWHHLSSCEAQVGYAGEAADGAGLQARTAPIAITSEPRAGVPLEAVGRHRLGQHRAEPGRAGRHRVPRRAADGR
jgi:hypothetical protein